MEWDSIDWRKERYLEWHFNIQTIEKYASNMWYLYLLQSVSLIFIKWKKKKKHTHTNTKALVFVMIIIQPMTKLQPAR